MCFIIHIFLKDLYNTAIPNVNFYLASSVDTNLSNHSLYNVTVFKKRDDVISDDSFMIFLQPQNLYFFLENDDDTGEENLIYHPNHNNNNNIEKNFKCSDNHHFEIAYSLSINNNNDNNINKVICHRKLEYLKKIYTQRVFYKTFESLQDPIKVIKTFINNYYYNYVGKEIVI